MGAFCICSCDCNTDIKPQHALETSIMTQFVLKHIFSLPEPLCHLRKRKAGMKTVHPKMSNCKLFPWRRTWNNEPFFEEHQRPKEHPENQRKQVRRRRNNMLALTLEATVRDWPHMITCCPLRKHYKDKSNQLDIFFVCFTAAMKSQVVIGHRLGTAVFP